MKTYVVAGGAGFIGSHLCEELIHEGDRVICIDNLITGEESNIAHLFDNKDFVFINYDVIVAQPSVGDKIDGVFHLASPASPNAKSPRSYINHPLETLLVNSRGTQNLLDLARENKTRFLYASSSEVYGDPDHSPQEESYFGNVNPSGIRSVYDEAKRFGEAITMAYNRVRGVDVLVARIFNTYGPKMQKDDGRVVSNFINQALSNEPITVYGDGKQTRSFCYVDDLVSGLMSAMKASKLSERIFNLGNPEEFTILDLANKIKDLTSTSSGIVYEDLPEDDPHQRRPEISRAKQQFDFEPKIGLDEGLKKTIQYFKQMRSE